MTSVETTYLRHHITITPNTITVRTPEGRRIAAVSSVKQARLLIRGCRKADRA